MAGGSSSTDGLIHGTCVAVDGRAAVLLGPSGAGKSDLALRAIGGSWRDGARRLEARLVADDQVLIEVRGRRLVARAPAAIAGRIEVRGIGILEVDAIEEATLVLAIALVAPGKVERLPDPAPVHALLGCELPLVRLAPFEASAALKLVLAIVRCAG